MENEKQRSPALPAYDETVLEALARTKNGDISQSLTNCLTVLTKDERLRGMFKYNLFNGKLTISGNSWWTRTTPDLSQNDVYNLCLYFEQYGIRSDKRIEQAISIVGYENSYHPIQERLNSLEPWDGKDRISELLPRYLGADRSRITTEATKLLLLGAISRVFRPGEKFEYVVVLADQKQGSGKSTLCRLLSLEDAWFSDDLKRIDDENVFRRLQNHWIIELSEMLATANARTIEDVKAFVSRLSDTYKIPYDKFPHDFPRQCIFLGTTNKLECLPRDVSGNRRFIPVICDYKKAIRHPLDDENETRKYIECVWAQALAIYRSGDYSLVFPRELEPELENIRSDCTPDDPDIGKISSWLEDYQGNNICTLMIYEQALGLSGRPESWQIRHISEILDSNAIPGWTRHRSRDGKLRFSHYGRQRAWVRTSPTTVTEPSPTVTESVTEVSPNRHQTVTETGDFEQLSDEFIQQVLPFR